MKERIRTVNGAVTKIGVPRHVMKARAAVGTVGYRVQRYTGRWDRLPTMSRTAAPGRTISAADPSPGWTAAGSPRRPVCAPARAASVALVGLFVLALFAVLYVARAFVVPIVLAMHLALVLSPAVRALRR